MNIKHYFKPWVLITTGIMMNIVSAVVSHYFISQNNESIYSIEKKITAREGKIVSLWQQKNEMERKKEFILLLLNNQPEHQVKAGLSSYLINHLSSLKQHYLSAEQHKLYSAITLDITTTINITQLAQQNIINDINDQYFEKLDLETVKKPLDDNNAILYSIAIFMQLFGLILVLSRDLTRQ